MTLRLNGSTSGYTEIDAPAVAGNNNIKLPTGNGSANQFLKNGATAGTLGWSSLVEDSSGRLLVGTSSTSDSTTAVLQGRPGDANGGGKLTIQGNYNGDAGATYGEIEIKSAGGIVARISGQGDLNHASGDTPGRLVFSTCPDNSASPVERMRITQEGYARFNTTGDPNTAGNIGAQIGFSGQNFWRSRSSGTASYGHMLFHNDNGAVGGIATSGSSTSFTTSSDYRLKENVVPLTGAIDRVSQLQVHRFNFIADPDRTVDGFIAHEAQAVVPECVTGTKDEVDADGSPVYQGIDQSKLVPLLTAALQEAIAKIETLESRIAALEVTP
jgi:hypothetical protein